MVLTSTKGGVNKGEEKASVGPETETVFLNFYKSLKIWSAGIDAANLCGLAGRCDNPIPTRFLAPMDCSTVPAQYMYMIEAPTFCNRV